VTFSPAKRTFHYAWVVAAITFLTLLIGAGVRATPSVLIVPLERDFHWSRATISFAISVNLVLYGLIGPFAAELMNRFGVRRVIAGSLLVVSTAVALTTRMTSSWQLVMLWGVLVGCGTGMTALVLGATVATRWFNARRGLVVGILAASTATGQLIFLPLLANLTEHYGWRLALAMMCGLLAVAALVILALMLDRPADVGQRAFGDDGTQPLAPASPPSAAIVAAAFNALKDASKTSVFWILFGTFFICGASTFGLIQTHLIPMCADYGLPASSAAGLLAAMGVFDFIGTIASGWLSDRYDNRWLLFWYYGLRGLSLMFLPFTNFNFYGLSLFAVFYGLDWIATVPPTVKLTAQKFGPERANLVFGWIFAGHQIGAAFAAFAAGMSRTFLATYLPAFFAAGALCLIASLAALAIDNKRRPHAKPVVA
jgi:predicted MFS family arabinose efflux permease